MKIAISSTGTGPDSEIDPRFGRCAYYITYDQQKDSYEAIENKSRNATGGAGIQAAQAVANMNVDAVITTNIGPNAYRVLETAGIKVYSGITGSVKEAVGEFKKGSIETAKSPNVGQKFGMGGKV